MKPIKTPHVLTLTSPSAVSLWKGEFLGQLSDGMWENTRPLDHWRFWHHCDVVLGAVNNLDFALDNWERPRKVGYNFAALIPIVGDRMLKCGRFGKALPELLRHELGGCILDGMPDTLEEFTTNHAKRGDMPRYAAAVYEMVTLEQAARYYATAYTMKEMREDIERIKTALRSANPKSSFRG
jgi:hypothetical protein